MTKILNIKEHESFSTEKEYRASPLPSYSLIKDMDFNPRVLITPRKEKKTDFFDLGNLVDTLITDKDNFNDYYYISNSKLPSISDIITEIYNRKLNLTDEKYKKKIIGIGREFNYQPNWKDDTLYNYLKNKGTDYLDKLKEASGRQVVSDDNFLLANDMANAVIEKHDYLVKEITKYDELVFQFKYRFEYKNVFFKMMTDIIKIDHFTKTLTPIDIKTGSVPTHHFYDNFIKFKYYYQAGLYTLGLQKLINKLNVEYNNSYTVNNFKFIYISKYSPNYPLVYNFTNSWYNRAHNGWTDLVRNRKIKGLAELTSDYNWYLENDLFEASKDVLENYDVEIELPNPPLAQLMARTYEID